MKYESVSREKSLEQLLREAPDNLVVLNPDSSTLQLYELHTPFMILLETCHEKGISSPCTKLQNRSPFLPS